MVRITKYSDILVNSQKLSLTIDTVYFQGKSNLLVQKNVNLQYDLKSANSQFERL